MDEIGRRVWAQAAIDMVLNGDESTRQQYNRGPGMSVVRFRELIKYELIVDKKKVEVIEKRGW